MCFIDRGSGTQANRKAGDRAGNVDEIELEPVSGFEQLHPALQHHIVNSLGWRESRPFQDAVIPKILDGEHLIGRAATAGGKTEAAPSRFVPYAVRGLGRAKCFVYPPNQGAC